LTHTADDWVAAAAIMTRSSATTPPTQLHSSAHAHFVVRLSMRCCLLMRTWVAVHILKQHLCDAVAFALDAQVMDAVPFDAATAYGDQLVDVVLTPTRIIGPGAADWK
jgi:hypothetical protein